MSNDDQGKPSPADEAAARHTSNAGQFIRAYVERTERLEEEIKALNDDKRDVYAEAKANGFDVKALKTIVRMRKTPAIDRAEEDTILRIYMEAMGMDV